MALDIYSIQWEFEDDLPDMSDLEYGLLFPESKVIDGVRMFPFIEHWKDGTPTKLYLGC